VVDDQGVKIRASRRVPLSRGFMIEMLGHMQSGYEYQTGNSITGLSFADMHAGR
jgi:hypothetical protein